MSEAQTAGAAIGDDTGRVAGLLGDLVADARRAGADAADALAVEGVSVSAACRLGRTERLERAEGTDLGLRVFVGRRMAMVSSSDRSPAALVELVERAVAMARAVPEDPYCGLADPAALATDWPDLDLADPVERSTAELMAQARTAEEAALDVVGVTNSEGAEAAWSRSAIFMVASNGFAGGYAVTSGSLSASVIAERDGAMETDYDFSMAVYGEDLEPAATIGRTAGERAVRRLGAQKIASARLPVVFDPRVSGGLLRHLAGAISGSAIARGTSFLKDKMGAAVFRPGIRIVDDPRRRRGHRSKPFDGEGLANGPRALIEDGRLQTWLLDLRAAAQLGLSSTGHASRGTSSPPQPAPTNLYLEPGSATPEALIGGISHGLYVTQLMGMGVNTITGDYSRGASGFLIRDGQLDHAVSEVTIAGNLADMFACLVPASDLVHRTGVDAPTVVIEPMTVAGL